MLASAPKTNKLPIIPDKRYFTIGEVSQLCQVKSHVLRYWEQEFKQLNPVRRGNRRYYQRQDVILIRQIYHLLYEQRFTIDGARSQLNTRRRESTDPPDHQKISANSPHQQPAEGPQNRRLMDQLITELTEVLDILKDTTGS